MKPSYYKFILSFFAFCLIIIVIGCSVLSCYADTPTTNLVNVDEFIFDARFSNSQNKIVSGNGYFVTNMFAIGLNDYIYITAEYLDRAIQYMDTVTIAICSSIDKSLEIGTSIDTVGICMIGDEEDSTIPILNVGNDIYRFDVSSFHNKFLFICIRNTTYYRDIANSLIVNYDGNFGETINIFDSFSAQISAFPSIFGNLGYFQDNSLTIIGTILFSVCGFGVVCSLVKFIFNLFRGD